MYGPVPPKSKMLAPSTKNGRRSWRNCSTVVRLTNAGSDSTWPKSGFTAASSVRFDVTPYFTSSPAPPKYECPRSNGLPKTGRSYVPQTHQMAEARGVSGLGFPLERPLAALVLAEHPAEEVYAPHLVARLGEPQLRERDPHLNDPAQRIDRRRDVPHGVPRPIPDEEVVAANVVLLHPGGIYGELKRRAVVVVAVKVHVKHVALRIVVTAAETARNLGGLGVVQPRAQVDRGVVVHDHHRRRFDGRRPFLGIGLREAADAPGLLPRGVVEPAVEHGWALDPDSRHDGRRTSARMTQSGGIGGYLYEECGRDHQHRRQPP